MPIKAREAKLRERILDCVAVKVCHRSAWVDDRVDVFGAKESIEAAVAARLVREKVRSTVVGRRAKRRALRAVHADADEVGLCKRAPPFLAERH
jgi:hypothetical protein